MSKYLELYASDRDDFENNGVPLVDASGVSIRPQINEPTRLSFNVPVKSRNRAAVKRGAVVRAEGELYVLTGTGEGTDDSGGSFFNAIGIPILFAISAKKHLPKKFKIGAEAGIILQAAFSDVMYGKNEARMLNSDELAELGLEPVTERTDIDRDKLNPLEVLEVVMSHLGGELYVSNFTFALVKSLGRETGAVFELTSSAQGIERVEDDSEVVTRLFPYGRNNVEITNANGGIMFLDSPYINDYLYVRAGFVDFSDIERPADLLRVARRLFLPENYFRIDKVKTSYRVGVIDLWKAAVAVPGGRAVRLKIGDYARVIDREHDFDARVRVVALEEYLFEPQRTVVTLGDPPRFIVDVLDDVESGNSFFWKPKINMLPAPDFNLDDIWEEILDRIDIGQFDSPVPIRRWFPTADDPEPDPEHPLPDGIYSIEHLKSIDAMNKETWEEKPHERDIVYLLPYEGDFEDAVTAAVLRVLEELGVSV